MSTANRLTEKLKAASGVAARASADIEARADHLISRESEIRKKSERAFAPHHAHLDEASKGLDDLEAQLKLLSNESPLQESGDTGGATEVRPLPAGGR